MNTKKAPELSDVPLELITVSKEVVIQVMVKLYQSSRWIGNTRFEGHKCSGSYLQEEG